MITQDKVDGWERMTWQNEGWKEGGREGGRGGGWRERGRVREGGRVEGRDGE